MNTIKIRNDLTKFDENWDKKGIITFFLLRYVIIYVIFVSLPYFVIVLKKQKKKLNLIISS